MVVHDDRLLVLAISMLPPHIILDALPAIEGNHLVELIFSHSHVLILNFGANVVFWLEIEDSLAGRGRLVCNFNIFSIKDGFALILFVQDFLGEFSFWR